MITLRPYQQAAVAAVYDHLRKREDNPVVAIPTGGGKTPVIATLCKDAVIQWNGRVLILAHVKELLEQTADKLRHICPEVAFGIYSAGLKRRDTEDAVIVAGIQSVYRRACEFESFDLVIVDECFPAGTPISTPTGMVNIEDVRAGDTIETALGPRPVLATRSRFVSELVHIEVSDGTHIHCTPNHQFFSHRGWTEAGLLEVGAILFRREDVLALRRGIPPLEEGPTGRLGVGVPGKTLVQAGVLLHLLLEEAREPDEPERGSPESSGKAAGDPAQTDPTRRQWPSVNTAAVGPLARSRRRLGGRSRHTDGNAQELRLSHELQTGPRQSASENGDRDRWPEPPAGWPTGSGYQEGRDAAVARVVRVSREQCTSPRAVFNLHVDGHPSYFAHGKLVHNCHLIPPDGEGIYRQFLADAKVVNPHLRVIGLTATPYRMTTGLICAPDHFLNAVCYEVGVRELIRDGYLCGLVTKSGSPKADTTSLHVRGGEFVAGEVEELMDTDELVESACAEIVELTRDRKSVLIFASGILHGRHVQREMQDRHGIECGFVCGETPANERDELLARFRCESSSGLFPRKPLKYLCNVNVLTTGFDAPNIDCVVMLRPTLSPGLYYQMVGRGFRLHPDKASCLILDYGGNVLRHGPVDAIRVNESSTQQAGGAAPAKECPQCRSVIAAGYAVCPDCGYEFPPPDRTKHEAKASDAGILSGQATDTEFEVRDVAYSVHTKRDAPNDAPKTMRVDYRLGLDYWVSEWICFEHTGYARRKAEVWWKQRSPDPVPDTAEQAVDIANAGGVAHTEFVTVRSIVGEQFDRIMRYKLGPVPEPVPVAHEIDLDEVPF